MKWILLTEGFMDEKTIGRNAEETVLGSMPLRVLYMEVGVTTQ